MRFFSQHKTTIKDARDASLLIPKTHGGASLQIYHNPTFACQFYACAAFFFIFCTASFAKTADFIVLTSPQSLTIFNQYEQPLSSEEKALLQPGIPLQILKADVRLGDQITRAMQCKLGQNNFYVLKSEAGEILHGKGNFQVLKSCMLFSDTMVISQNGLYYSSQFPNPTFDTPFKKGEALVLLFRTNTICAIKLLRPENPIVWAPVNLQSALQKKTSQTLTPDTALSSFVREQIVEQINFANELYKKFFNEFNKNTRLQKSAPFWNRVSGEKELRWTLNAPYNQTRELDESTQRLVEDVRDIIIGKPFTVTYSGGELAVSPK